MSENTVRKYVTELEEKRFIHTEPTVIRTKEEREMEVCSTPSVPSKRQWTIFTNGKWRRWRKASRGKRDRLNYPKPVSHRSRCVRISLRKRVYPGSSRT